MGFIDWLKGFRKTEYKFDLLEGPVDLGTKLPIKEVIEIEDLIHNLPIYNVTFGLRTYSAEISDDNLLIREQVERTNSSICFHNVSLEYFKTENFKEFNVLTTVFSLGLDNKIWKFSFLSFFTCQCYNNEFDSAMINSCIKYTSGMVKLLELNHMCKIPITIQTAYKNDAIKRRHFEGYIQTFGDCSVYEQIGLEDVLPKLENESTSVMDAVNNNCTLEEFIKKDSLIVDVIRKTRKHSGDIQPLNIDVLRRLPGEKKFVTSSEFHKIEEEKEVDLNRFVVPVVKLNASK